MPTSLACGFSVRLSNCSRAQNKLSEIVTSFCDFWGASMRTAESPKIEVTNPDGELSDEAIASLAAMLLSAADDDDDDVGLLK